MVPEAAVVVTDFLKHHRRPLFLLPVFGALVLSFQNCTVDMLQSTPGATSVSCVPDPAAVANFEDVLNDILMPTGVISGTTKVGCASCHGSLASDPANAVYMIFEGDTATNPELVQTNFCAAARLGDTLVTRPMNPGHGGGQYLETEIQSLVDFVNNNF